MDLIPQPDLDVRVEGEALYPALLVVPTNEVEERLLRDMIAQALRQHSTVRWGRRGDRRRGILSHYYRMGEGVRWGRGERRGWCFSVLKGDVGGLAVATRLVSLRGETHLIYSIVAEGSLDVLHQGRLMRYRDLRVELDIPDALIEAWR